MPFIPSFTEAPSINTLQNIFKICSYKKYPTCWLIFRKPCKRSEGTFVGCWVVAISNIFHQTSGATSTVYIVRGRQDPAPRLPRSRRATVAKARCYKPRPRARSTFLKSWNKLGRALMDRSDYSNWLFFFSEHGRHRYIWLVTGWMGR